MIKITVTCPSCGGSREIGRRHACTVNLCRSCGVGKRKRSQDWNTTHGGSRTDLYAVWASMKARCYRESHKYFQYYGGRGITVCSEWLESFSLFKGWAMVSGYVKGLVLDRERNNEGYSPSNCRWVTQAVNNRNKSDRVLSNLLVMHARALVDQNFCLADLAWAFDVPYKTLWAAVHNENYGL